MSTAAEQPRGHVKNKGSWTGYNHSLPDSQLTSSADVVGVIDEAFPQPQANSLEKVACVTESVFGGANTTDSIAEALDVESREGRYYANAAGYLGLIETIPGDGVKSFGLTSLGQRFTIADDSERALIMEQLVAQTPGVQVYDDGGEDALIDYLMETGLNETTAKRRVTTITTWRACLSSAEDFKENAHEELLGTKQRVAAAARRATEARVAARRERVPVTNFCGCGMQLSLSGVCDFC